MIEQHCERNVLVVGVVLELKQTSRIVRIALVIEFE